MSQPVHSARVHVDVAGTGEPSLLFVHGVARNLTDWSAQAQELASEFKVISPDLPGHGRSAPPEAVGIEHLARTLTQVRRCHAGAGCVLIGHSVGCRVALEAFRQDRDGITGLVLLEQSFIGGGDPEAAARQLQSRIDEGGWPAFAQARIEQMFLPGSDPALRERVRQDALRFDPAFARALLADAIRWEACVPELLAGLTVPVLLLQSTYVDEHLRLRPMSEDRPLEWLPLFPQGILRIITQAGHFAQIEAAEAVTGHIRLFVRSLRAT